MNSLFLYFAFGAMLGYLTDTSKAVIILVSILILRNSFSYWNRKRRTTHLAQGEALGGLIALLRIRSSEVGAMYSLIRDFQKKIDGENSWAPIFMGEYRNLMSYDIYEDCREKREKKEQKYRTRAHNLFNKRRKYDHYYALLEEKILSDLEIAMFFWSSNLDMTISFLKTIPCERNISRHVCALLKEYKLIKFLTLNGNYHILFKNWPLIGNFVRERYNSLISEWKEVRHLLQASILTTQAGNVQQVGSSLFDSIWAEIQTLSSMESNLERAILQKNSRSSGWAFDTKNEEPFFEQLKFNPIWKKLYSYPPYESNSPVTLINKS